MRSKIHLINVTKDSLIILDIQKIPRILGALCQGWDKNQIHFLLHHGEEGPSRTPKGKASNLAKTIPKGIQINVVMKDSRTQR